MSRELETSYATTGLGELIGAKIDASWGMNKDILHAPNIHMMAHHLHAALYLPESLAGHIPASAQYPDREQTLLAALPLNPAAVPALEEFVSRVQRAVTRETDYRACLYDDTEAAVSALSERGHITIWTAGDVAGFREQGIPGSRQQLFKVAAGLGTIRRRLAQKKQAAAHDVISVVAGENKHALLPGLFAAIRNRGSRTIVVAEDSLYNLLQCRDAAEQHGFAVRAFLVRRGEPRSTSLPSALADRNRYIVVNSLLDMTARLRGDEQESVLDFDGVISNDQARTQAFKDAIVNAIGAEGWL